MTKSIWHPLAWRGKEKRRDIEIFCGYGPFPGLTLRSAEVEGGASLHGEGGVLIFPWAPPPLGAP